MDHTQLYGATSHILPEGGVNHDAPPTTIDSKSIAYEIRSEISKTVRYLKSSYGKVPGLAVILVGQRRDSQSYVRYNIKACNEVGIRSLVAQLLDSCSDEEAVESIERFHKDLSVHGILVQLPLPHIQHATVSIVHAYTPNPEEITREADIVILAAGVARQSCQRQLVKERRCCN